MVEKRAVNADAPSASMAKTPLRWRLATHSRALDTHAVFKDDEDT